MITAFAWPLTLTVGENHELLLVGHADGTVSCVRVTPSGHITSEDLPHCAQPNGKNAKIYYWALITFFLNIFSSRLSDFVVLGGKRLCNCLHGRNNQVWAPLIELLIMFSECSQGNVLMQ